MKVLLVIAAITGLCIGLFTPLFSMFLERHGVSDYMIGLSSTMYFLGVAVCGLWGARLLINYGVRFVLILGLLLSCSAILWFLIIPTVELSFIVRIILGAGLGFYMSSMQTAVLQRVTNGQYGKVSAIYALCFGAGMGIGPIIATGFYGQDGSIPLIFGFSVLLIALSLSFFLIKKEKPVTGLLSDSGENSCEFTRDTGAGWKSTALYGAFVYGVVEAVVLTLYPVYWVRAGMPLDSLGQALGLLVVGGLIATPLAGWVADRKGEKVTLFMLSLSAIPAIFLLTLLNEGILLLICAFITGATVGPIFAISMAMIGNAQNQSERATGSSSFTLAFGMGCIVGPLFSAWAMSIISDKAVFIFSLLVLLCFMIKVSLPDRMEVKQLS